jgi:hypothetical protein
VALSIFFSNLFAVKVTSCLCIRTAVCPDGLSFPPFSKSLISIATVLFVLLGRQQNHKGGKKNKRHCPKKNVPKVSFAYLGICYRGEVITA